MAFDDRPRVVRTGLAIYSVVMTILVLACGISVSVLFIRTYEDGTDGAVDLDTLPVRRTGGELNKKTKIFGFFQSKVERFHVDGETVEQHVQLDAARQVEIVRYDSGVILALDYRRVGLRYSGTSEIYCTY